MRVSRYLFYIADILRQIIENGGIADKLQKVEKVKKQKFSITFKELSNSQISETPIPVSEFTRRVSVDINGKIKRHPTAVGETLGIKTEDRVGARGPYTVLLYDRNAQQLPLDNRSAIVDINGSGKN